MMVSKRLQKILATKSWPEKVKEEDQMSSSPGEEASSSFVEELIEEDKVVESKAKDNPFPSIENASTPMVLDLPQPDAKGPWIEYTGVATVRVIDEKDWAAIGLNSSKRYQWNYLNQKRLPKSDFSEEELHYLLNVDGRFKLTETVSDTTG